MRKPAKIDTHAGVVIRFDKGAATFSADGFDGLTWPTLPEVKAAIDKANDEALEIPAYVQPGSRYDGDPGELGEVTIVGVQASRHSGDGVQIRYKNADGRLETDWGGNLHPRTPEVLDAWNRHRALLIEAHRLEERAALIEADLPRIKDVDERVRPPTMRRRR